MREYYGVGGNHLNVRCPAGSFPYVIKSGDTLYKLANEHNTTVDAIMKINPGINPNNLQIGQVICIPEKASARCPAGTFEYTIKQGDTIYKLAQQYNTTVDAILRANPGINPNNLQIGQVICIPGKMPGKCPSGTFEYTIKQGDTIYKLAQQYNTTVDAILRANPGINPNNLQIGQVICIPEKASTKCPAGTFEYTIKQGDTIYKLAQQYNTTVDAILRANPGINPNNLQIGQVICIPGKMPGKCPSGTFEYTIKQGDTIYKLAIQYNTTVEAILRANPGINPDNLQIGQVICIPGKMPGKCPSGTFEYTIKQGDTIYKLAQKYNTTVEAILKANPGINPDNLQIGQVICIPEGSKPSCDGIYYVVRRGDTLYSIAQRYGVSLAELMAANPGVDPNNLQIGQMICIPEKEKPVKCPGGTVHTVGRNETLGSILLRYNISLMDLMAGNKGIDVYNLVAGQEICILPHQERGCPCPMGTESYTITKNDIKKDVPVVVVLAERFNTTVESIMMINSNLSPGDFVLGKQICMPSMK